MYFDLDCVAWQDTQLAVLQRFLRYLVEIYMCINASELIMRLSMLCPTLPRYRGRRGISWGVDTKSWPEG